jgi:hypothetical protein
MENEWKSYLNPDLLQPELLQPKPLQNKSPDDKNPCSILWKYHLNRIMAIYKVNLLTEENICTLFEQLLQQKCFDKTLLEQTNDTSATINDTTFAHQAAYRSHKRFLSLLLQHHPKLKEIKDGYSKLPETYADSILNFIESEFSSIDQFRTANKRYESLAKSPPLFVNQKLLDGIAVLCLTHTCATKK